MRLKQLLSTFLLSSIPAFLLGQVIKSEGGYLNINSGTYMIVHGDIENMTGATLNNAGTIIVSGDIINDGTSMLMGATEMNGSTEQAITGASTIDFNELTINNSATGIIMSNDINVANTLNMTDGDINLNGSIIELGPTGTLINESNDKRIYGTTGLIRANRILNAPSANNVAGLGFEITSTANLGLTQIERGHSPQTGNNNTSIERYFDISPVNNTSLNAAILFHYFENELASHTEANLIAWKSTDLGQTWNNQGGTIDVANNQLALGAIDGFSRWTLSDVINEYLPLEGLEFTARLSSKNQVQLDWITQAEINTSHFEVERSKDAHSFEKIGVIQAAGNSEDFLPYELLDQDPYKGISYYRLKIVDLNTESSYSEIRAIYIEDRLESISLYPNPVSKEGILYIQGLPSNQVLNFRLYNALGQLLLERSIVNQTNYELTLKNFPAADYFYTIQNEETLLKSGMLLLIN